MLKAHARTTPLLLNPLTRPVYRHPMGNRGASLTSTAAASPASTSTSSQEEDTLSDFHAHQSKAPRLSIAVQARTLVASSTWGVLSTISSGPDSEGFPSGSVVEYAVDDRGLPHFALSTLSPHTRDVQRDGRVSLTVPVQGSKGLPDARATLTGSMERLAGGEAAAAEALYRARHPGSYWVGFGDFAMYRMASLRGVRLVGGFARAGRAGAEEYLATAPDPVAAFSAPIARHMNADHGEACVAMVRHCARLPARAALLLAVDELGMDLEAELDSGERLPVRLGFLAPAPDRKAVKDRIVELTRASSRGG
ncbi:hypothetical protein ACKKBF_B03435 [Auxenochlorella protothecoides x Auxenochlorella symbiontica]